MIDQNNTNINSDNSSETDQQSTDEIQETQTKTKNKRYLLYMVTTIVVIIITGIVSFLLYNQSQNNQKQQTLEKNINTPNEIINTNNDVADYNDNTDKLEALEKTDNIVENEYNTFLLFDDAAIYEADLSENKIKIVDLPFSQPIEILETYISKDKNTYLWTHTNYSKNDMNPEPRDIISYIYRRNTDSLKKFGILETKTNEQTIIPIQLSPNGKYLMSKKRIENNKSQLVIIDTATKNESIIFDNYNRRWDKLDGYDEIENTEFKRWNDNSQNFYYTKYLSTSNTDSKLWVKKFIKLFKYNLISRKSNTVLEGKDICTDSIGIIPSKYNENIAIVSCGSNEYNEIVRVYTVNITTKKSELIFEGYNRDIAGIHIGTVTPDGNKFVYYLLPRKSVFVYDITKKERKKINLKQNFNGNRYFSNDSTKILYENQHIPTITKGIFSYDFETDEINQIFKDNSLHILDF